MSNVLVFLLSALCLLSLSCGSGTVINGTGAGSTTTSFQKGGGSWSISGSASARRLYAGQFFADTTTYPDLAVVTDTGIFLYDNLIASNSIGWGTSTGRISSTVNIDYSATSVVDFDLDTNALLDFFVYSAAGFKALKNAGSGNFTTSSSLPGGLSTNWLQPASFKNRSSSTGENSLWLFSSASSASGQRYVKLIDNEFVGGLQAYSQAAVTSGVKVLSADLNADSYIDFVLIPSDGSSAIQVMENSEDATFIERSSVFSRLTSNSIRDAVLQDFNGDGLPDLLLATSAGFELQMNESNASLIDFTESSSDLTFGIASVPTDVSRMEYVNLTEDSLFDLFLVRSDGSVLLLVGTSAFSFMDITSTALSSAELPTNIIDFAIKDIDRDRVNDVVLVTSTGDVSTFFNLADDSSDVDE